MNKNKERDENGRFIKGHTSYWRKKRKEFVCHNCKKKFKPTRNNKYRRFCSINCCNKFYSKIPIKLKGVYKNCLTCKKKIYVKPCLKSRNSFCSKLCFNKWQKGKLMSDGKSCFKKGNIPFNKGKKWEEVYGEEKTNELKIKQSIKKKEEWKDLSFREKSMVSRSPKKLKKFREKAKKWREEHKEELNERLNKMRKLNTIKRRKWLK